MQSLSLSMRSLAGLRLPSPEARVMRKRSEIVACASEGDSGSSISSSSFISRTQTYALLKQQMEVAAKSEGIRVQVRSVYIEGRSQPSKGLYFFAYRIRITNTSDHPVQLLRRHWIITDANGRTENVWGIGVVGEQPVIHPGTSFEYSSACPLSTPNGRMEGDFEMIHIESVGSRSFNVAIAPFSLSLLGDDDSLTI
ncbi:hypothetical protein SESBI_31239 [Sesbania bispinosa]|nr:hypothetical protein SESBI_31239 [Sesbania bispinosa]